MLPKSQYSAMLALAARKIVARLCADYRGKALSWCVFFAIYANCRVGRP